MEDLINTDIGLITKDNANWLFSQWIVTREGHINYNLKDGMIEKKVQIYSYFRWIIQDIKEKIPSTPRQIYLEIDDLINIMRFGEIDKTYEYKKDEFHYIARYPKVDNIYNIGRKVCLEHQKSDSRKKRDFVDFEDLI